MHSRIFQVDTKPIDKKNYINESDFYEHWFLTTVADYIDSGCDRNADIDWLKICCPGVSFGSDENEIFFVVDDKEKFFTSKFIDFKAKLVEINSMVTIEEFVNGFTYKMMDLNDLYEEKQGFYIYEHDNMMSLDAFIRECDSGIKYYIGQVLDYHF